ncbi:MAG: hypothetical protein C0425_04400 [Chlorobiaceae bacterium]|nr:hypothetical protein [Chlorobiaceae bacterium]MBA4309558.1 hypothetical protein [Chlorobiaceae bacterium]
MIIKNFTKDLLTPVAKLCRQSMELDIMPDFLLEEKIFHEPDYNPELTLVAFSENNSEPVGFIQAVVKARKDESIGYVKLFCVAPDYRRKGIGKKLYEAVEEKIKAQKIKLIRVYESYPNYFMPGVDPFYTEAISFFERMGFKKFSDTSNLICDLVTQDFDTANDEKELSEKNIICKRADESDKEKISQWLKINFEAWIPEVAEAYKNNPISLHIALDGDEMLGFSAHEVNNRGTGWFGPMGTSAAARGKGIGSILLKRCLNDMKEIGHNKAIIPWVGPIPFYMNYVNAKMQRIFWRYEKNME